MKLTVKVASDIVRSPRVLQVEGLFDVPPTQRAELSWVVNLPIEEQAWNVGLIVGPSGCGKSSVARQAFGKELARFEGLRADWQHGRSLLDGFPAHMGIKEVVEMLSSVGFSSPPSWVRPFEVLSNGEQFRVLMARMLAETPADEIAVVDEFTSVIDRTVARVGSSATAKAVRKRGQRFVAVTCHEDVEEWLQPDWVYRPAEQRFAWRSVQSRPKLKLSIFRVRGAAWRLFKHHHYLTHDLNPSATCFVGVVDFPDTGPRIAAFDSWLPFVGKLSGVKQGRRVHRTVCLPDYQGAGIAAKMGDFTASLWAGLGYRCFLGTSHPGFIAQRRRSPNWTMTKAPTTRGKGSHAVDVTRSTNRLMASFEYVGAPMPRAQAEKVMNTWLPI
jgi:ABC-type lipoprotein export system ATPase subunit